MITQEQIRATIERAEKQIEEMKELLKTVDMEQSSRRKYGGLYWYIGDIGQIKSVTENDILSDNYRHEIGNYYLTPEDAERAEKQIKLFRLLDRFSRQNGWTDDIWEDGSSEKWYIYCGQCGRTIETGFTRYHRDIHQVYFISESVAKQAIKKYHDLIMEVMAI